MAPRRRDSSTNLPPISTSDNTVDDSNPNSKPRQIQPYPRQNQHSSDTLSTETSQQQSPSHLASTSATKSRQQSIQSSRVQYGMIQAANISPTDSSITTTIPEPSTSSTPKRNSSKTSTSGTRLKREKFGTVSQLIGRREKESEWRHELIVRQQPLHARMCGFGEKDRRPIDPPPIIQLIVYDTQTQTVDFSMLQNPFFVLHVTLWSADGLEERNLISNPPGHTRVLMGSLVSSPSLLKDNDGASGCFFVFPDLSIRTEGIYRLKFSLMKLGTEDFLTNSSSLIITSVFSEPFTVYSAKKFPGMTESTELSKAFAKQGVKIPIRNDVRIKKI